MRQPYLFYFSKHTVLYLKYFKGAIKLLVFDTDTESPLMTSRVRLVRETDEMGRKIP